MTFLPQHTAFIFPGQGSQRVGMGQALATADPTAAKIFSQANEILGFPLRELCWNGPEEVLNQTVNAQPALLTHSIAALSAFQVRRPDFIPRYTTGHSLGLYSALVAAGSLTFPDALRLVRERGQAMTEAGKLNPGGMVAVLGMDLSEIEVHCERITSERQEIVQIANDNCPGQVVISGTFPGLEIAQEGLLKAGARKAIRLAVSIASHCSLMEPAQSRLNRALERTEIHDPIFPVMGTWESTWMRTVNDVRTELMKQLTHRIRWTEAIQAMIKAGISTFIEFGPGKVLTGLIQRIDPQAITFPLDHPTSFTNLLE